MYNRLPVMTGPRLEAVACATHNNMGTHVCSCGECVFVPVFSARPPKS